MSRSMLPPSTVDQSRWASEQIGLLWRALEGQSQLAPEVSARGEEPGRWSVGPKMPGGPRWRMQGCRFMNRIHLAGGSTSGGGAALTRHEVYDLRSTKWTTAAPLPEGRTQGMSGVHRRRWYVVGGSTIGDNSGAALDSGLAYDFESDQWAPIEPMPGDKWAGASAMLPSGAFHVWGGRPGPTHYRYEVAEDAWMELAPFPADLVGPGGFSYGGMVYSVGGGTFPTYSPSSLFARYDPTKDKWENLRPIPVPIHVPAFGVADGRLWVIGGLLADGAPLSSMWCYHFVDDEWEELALAPKPTPSGAFYDANNFVDSGRIHVFGGRLHLTGGPTDAHDIFIAAPHSHERSYDAAVNVREVLGGGGGGGASRLADLTDVDLGIGPIIGSVGLVQHPEQPGLWAPGVLNQPGSHSELVGDGTTALFDVGHGLDTTAVLVGATDAASGSALVHGTDYTWLVVDPETVRIAFAVPPSAVEVTVVAGGGGGATTGAWAWRFDVPQVTIGPTGTGLRSGSTYARFTTTVRLGRAIAVEQVLWVAGDAGTFDLEVDGEVLAGGVVSAGDQQVLAFDLSGVVIPGGDHTFVLVPASPTRMRYFDAASWRDRWLTIEGWVEPGGSYHGHLQLVANPGSLVQL